MAKANDPGKADMPEIGYRAYLIKVDGKFIVAFPALEYDPNAERLTELQAKGIREISAHYDRAVATHAAPAVVIRFDPLRAALNTGGTIPTGPIHHPSGSSGSSTGGGGKTD